MSSALIPQPRIARDEYDAFCTLLRNDKEFPATYDAWSDRCTKERDKYVKQGKRVSLIDVHAEKFSDFCAARAQKPSLYVLGVFAAEQARKG